jgi:hypothetical protein
MTRQVNLYSRPGLVAAVSLGVLCTAPAHAFVFELGELSGSFDSTLSAGLLYRIDGPDRRFYGTANGGLQNSVNADDGNLNYPNSWASKAVKGTHDLELKWRNFGAFVRGTYFYDFENEDRARARTPLSEEALDRVGSGAQWLDMYVRGTFDLDGRSIDLRFGRQVLSLGESTFIPNGINVINPVDVSRLRVPGSELREALLPVNMAKASVALNERVSLEAFWLLEFRRTEIDPAGTYFSTNDFATRGGRNVYLGFGALGDQQPLGAISRGPDHEGNNFTQYGGNLRVSAPALGDTEFGFFFANYHSRLPVISAVTPTGPISSAFVQSTALALGQAQLVPAIVANTGTTQAIASQTANQLVGLALLNTPASVLPTLSSLPPFGPAFYPSAQAIARGAGQVGLLTAAATGRYFVEYPEDFRSTTWSSSSLRSPLWIRRAAPTSAATTSSETTARNTARTSRVLNARTSGPRRPPRPKFSGRCSARASSRCWAKSAVSGCRACRRKMCCVSMVRGRSRAAVKPR